MNLAHCNLIHHIDLPYMKHVLRFTLKNEGSWLLLMPDIVKTKAVHLQRKEREKRNAVIDGRPLIECKHGQLFGWWSLNHHWISLFRCFASNHKLIGWKSLEYAIRDPLKSLIKPEYWLPVGHLYELPLILGYSRWLDSSWLFGYTKSSHPEGGREISPAISMVDIVLDRVWTGTSSLQCSRLSFWKWKKCFLLDERNLDWTDEILGWSCCFFSILDTRY